MLKDGILLNKRLESGVQQYGLDMHFVSDMVHERQLVLAVSEPCAFPVVTEGDVIEMLDSSKKFNTIKNVQHLSQTLD